MSKWRVGHSTFVSKHSVVILLTDEAISKIRNESGAHEHLITLSLALRWFHWFLPTCPNREWWIRTPSKNNIFVVLPVPGGHWTNPTPQVPCSHDPTTRNIWITALKCERSNLELGFWRHLIRYSRKPWSICALAYLLFHRLIGVEELQEFDPWLCSLKLGEELSHDYIQWDDGWDIIPHGFQREYLGMLEVRLPLNGFPLPCAPVGRAYKVDESTMLVQLEE